MELSRDLEIIALQERELQFRSFNADVAWQLGLRIGELAVSRSASVVIDVRHFGQTPFCAALAGTSETTQIWRFRTAPATRSVLITSTESRLSGKVVEIVGNVS